MRRLQIANNTGTQAATVSLAFWGKLHVATPLVGAIPSQSSGPKLRVSPRVGFCLGIANSRYLRIHRTPNLRFMQDQKAALLNCFTLAFGRRSVHD